MLYLIVRSERGPVATIQLGEAYTHKAPPPNTVVTGWRPSTFGANTPFAWSDSLSVVVSCDQSNESGISGRAFSTAPERVEWFHSRWLVLPAMVDEFHHSENPLAAATKVNTLSAIFSQQLESGLLTFMWIRREEPRPPPPPPDDDGCPIQ